MEVKAGYKLTEVGVIPEDWKLEPIKNIADVFVGRDLKLSDFSFEPHDSFKYPVYSNTVENQGFYGYYKTAEYEGESITVVGRGMGIGTAFTRQGEYGAIGRLLVLFFKNKIEPHFISEYINNKLKFFEESGGIPQLTGTQLVKYKVPIPSKREQTAIAKVLSDTDALIQSLEKGLAKKQSIKQGAMQLLLTGKKRLPGFSGEWEVKKLGEVLKVRHGKSQHDVAVSGGLFPIIATSGVIGSSNEYLYNKPSVLIGRKGTIDIPRYMDTPFWAIDTIFYSEISEKVIPKLIYYRFLLIDWYSYNEASGVPSLSSSTIEKIELNLPIDKNEQNAIVEILNDMDDELAVLENKLHKYKQLKQGLMQNLLTGKIRLV